jgi:hypothetical protein
VLVTEGRNAHVPDKMADAEVFGVNDSLLECLVLDVEE